MLSHATIIGQIALSRAAASPAGNYHYADAAVYQRRGGYRRRPAQGGSQAGFSSLRRHFSPAARVLQQSLSPLDAADDDD